MNLAEAAQDLHQALAPHYGEGEADAIAHIVLEALTGLDAGAQKTGSRQEFTASQIEQLSHYRAALLRHEPVQYLVGKAWFYGMPLFVNEAVLIPRPETEELVHWVVSDVKARSPELAEDRPLKADETAKLKILDACTGSGCIALALKKALPGAEVWGCDISDEALNVARRNGAALDIRVDFQGADFLDNEQQKGLPSVDVLVSNPPYIPVGEKETLPANVARFEPALALFVPNEDPLLFYRALAAFGKHRLHPGGRIYAETHEALAQQVKNLFEAEGYTDVVVRKDMQGKERMVRAVR